MLHHRCIVIKDLVLPIGIRAFIIMNVVSRVTWRVAVVHLSLVHDRHVLLSIQHSLLLPRVLPAVAEIIAHVCLTCLTRLRGNQHNTIGGTRTVDCCRGSIFQNFHRLNIRRVQIVDTTANRHTINNVQRVRTVYRTDTAYAYLRIRIRLTRRLCDLHAAHLTLQRILNTRRLHQIQVVTVHLRDGCGHNALLLYTITDNHHIVQHLSVFFQCDGHLVSGFHLLALKANIRHNQCRALCNLHGELTVDVGDGRVLRLSFLEHGSTDYRFSVLVNHSTQDS